MQRVKSFLSNYFSWLSLTIIVLEAAIVFGLIYFFVPVGQLLKDLSGIVGTILSILIGIRVLVWFYREGRTLLNGDSSTEGGKLGVEGAKDRPIEAALQTTDERFDEAVKRITDWMAIDENGDIALTPEDDINDDPKYLLYVVAAKVAYKLGKRDSPRVPYVELRDEVTTSFPLGPFLVKAEPFLHYYHDGSQADSWSEVPALSGEEVEVEIDIGQIEGAVEWIETGSRNVPRRLINS